jgi:non-ribosomal peptide synthetase component F
VQVIEAAAPVELAVVELSALEVAEREARVREWTAQEATTPFDLSRGPLLRVKLLRLGEQEHVALLTMHHIVIDGWSLGIFIREIATLYEAFIDDRPSPLPELSIQYADFAVWQRAYLQGEVLEQQLKYWREQLAGAETVLQLPTDKPRPAIYSYRGAGHRFVLPTAVMAPVRKLSQEQGCTLFMTLLAVFKTLLYRYTEQEDILVGTAIANRNRSETEDLIGFFVNTLVLRTDLSGNPSFRKLMQRVRETTLGAYVHQDMPFEKLVEELQPERSLSQAPLFQVAFGVQNTPSQTFTLPGLELSQMEFDFDAGRFDLTLWISEYQDQLSGVWYYNTDLFEAATIKRMQGHFETLLQNVLAQPDAPLSEIEMLTADEKKQQLVQKQERLESNAQVLRTIRRKGISVPQATGRSN